MGLCAVWVYELCGYMRSLGLYAVWVNALYWSIYCVGLCTVWVYVLCGSMCCMGLCAVWVYALYGSMHCMGQCPVLVYVLCGSMRCMGLFAVWVYVLYGSMCCMGLCTVWVYALYGSMCQWTQGRRPSIERDSHILTRTQEKHVLWVQGTQRKFDLGPPLTQHFVLHWSTENLCCINMTDKRALKVFFWCVFGIYILSS